MLKERGVSTFKLDSPNAAITERAYLQTVYWKVIHAQARVFAMFQSEQTLF